MKKNVIAVLLTFLALAMLVSSCGPSAPAKALNARDTWGR